MSEQSIGSTTSNPDGGREVLLKAARDIPSAIGDLASEAYHHPVDTLVHAGKTLGSAAVMSTVLGAIIPSRGPAELLTAAAFTVPLLLGEYHRFKGTYDAAQMPGANIDILAKELARGTVSDTTDIGLSVIGGAAGGIAGRRLATSDTALGAKLQTAQRGVLWTENKSMMLLAKVPEFFKSNSTPAEGIVSSGADGMFATAAPAAGMQPAWFARFAPNTDALNTRLAQAANVPAQPASAFKEVYGDLHGHSNLSDGMKDPTVLYASAKEAGRDFYSITDHNHPRSRDGVGADDPRAADQANVPIITAKPSEYFQTFADAKAASKDGEFVGLVGSEMGTIGKVGGGHKGGGAGKKSDVPSMDGSDTGSPESPVQSILAHDHDHSHGPAVDESVPLAVRTTVRVNEPNGTSTTHEYTFKNKAAEVAGTEPIVVADPNHVGASATNPALGFMARTADGAPPVDLKLQAVADATARDNSHWGGVNHINAFELPKFMEAELPPRGGGGKPSPSFIARALGPIQRRLGFASESEAAAAPSSSPDVFVYKDGDYKSMVAQLDVIKDTTGGRPVIQLNHPRFKADWDPNLPPELRGRDYGIKSFDSFKQWQQEFGKYASLIEVITGQALNPHPVDVMKSSDLNPVNLAGYIDKGLHVSPTFGRDDHFGLPGGRPAGTGVLVTSLDKASLLDGLRERRTVATTSTKLLRGHMTANESHPMGTIFDQNAVPDLNIKMNIGGELDPKAKYTVKLFGDSKIGDGKLAEAVQTKELSGQELLDAQGQVAFDTVQTKLGNKSAYYVEVQRVDPVTSNTDYMWTAPVWVEPNASQHSLLTRGLVGAGSQFLLGLH